MTRFHTIYEFIIVLIVLKTLESKCVDRYSISMQMVEPSVVACSAPCFLSSSIDCTLQMKVLNQSVTEITETTARFLKIKQEGVVLVLCYLETVENGKLIMRWKTEAFVSKLNEKGDVIISSLKIHQLKRRGRPSSPRLKVSMDYELRVANITCSNEFPLSQHQTLRLVYFQNNGTPLLLPINPLMLSSELNMSNHSVRLTYFHQIHVDNETLFLKLECESIDVYTSAFSKSTEILELEVEMDRNIKLQLSSTRKILRDQKSIVFESLTNDFQLQCRVDKGHPLPKFYWIIDSGNRTFEGSLIDVSVFNENKFCCVANQTLSLKNIVVEQCVKIEWRNICLRKPTYQSSMAWSGFSYKAVDGYRDGIYNDGYCSHTDIHGVQWLLVNLERVYDIETVDIWSRTDLGDYGKMRNFSVLIGDKYMPCREDLLKNYSLCSTFNDIQPRLTTVSCHHRGQFILIMKGHSQTRSDPLIICEVEATGKVVPYIRPFLSPEPQKIETPMSLLMANNTAFKVITQDVEKVRLRGSNRHIHVLNNSAEPILWLSDKHRIIMAGGHVGRGKLIVVTNKELWTNILSHPSQAWLVGISSWYTSHNSRNVTLQIFDINRIRSLDNLQSGAIIKITEVKTLTYRKIDELLSLTRLGKVNLLVLIQNNYFNPAFIVILQSAGLYMSSDIEGTYLDYSETEVIIKDLGKVPYFSLQNLKNAILESYSSFIKYGPLLTKALRDIPFKAMHNIGIDKTYVLKLLTKYRNIADWKVPCQFNQIDAAEDKLFLHIYNELILSSEYLTNSQFKAPGVVQYPGDVTLKTHNLRRSVKIIAKYKYEYHSLGLYLLPGGTISVSISSGPPNLDVKEWMIQVGCWTDDISSRETWMRYPRIHSKHEMKNGTIYSAFGGNILIKNLNTHNEFIVVTLSGDLIEAPYFNIRDTHSINSWNKKRKASPAPWGEIIGDAIQFCVLSEYFIHWNTTEIMTFIENTMDKLVKSDYHLLGKDWRQKRREMVVFDRQISAGNGHSGYPIMGMLDWHDYLNITEIYREGVWGISHELGHNIQDLRFTWNKCHEVTTNIFTLYNNHYIFNISVFKRYEGIFDDSLLRAIKFYLVDRNADYQYWNENYLSALSIFSQLANSFGWALFKEVFRGPFRSSTDQEKIDEWMKRSSISANYNLAPLFDFWGIPLSESELSQVAHYTCFLPDDFITAMAPSRVNFILHKYENACVRSAKHVIDQYGDVEIRPLKENDVIFVN